MLGFRALLVLVVTWLCVGGLALAQSAPTDARGTETAAPDAPVAVTAATLATLRSDLEGSGLDEEAAQTLSARIDAVEARINATRQLRVDTSTYRSEASEASARRSELIATRNRLLEAAPPEVDDDLRPSELEAALAAAEDRFARLRADVEARAREVERISARQSQILTEANEAREQLVLIDEQLASLGANPAELSGRIQRADLLARQAFRQAQIGALEAERQSRPERLQLAQSELDLAQLRLERVAGEIEILQELTGELRRREARELQRRNFGALLSTTDPHPLVNAIAEENNALLGRLGALTDGDPNLSRLRADVQTRSNEVSNNLSIATQLTEIGELDRRAGETLRRLRASVPVLGTLRADRERTRAEIIEARQDQLLAQEELRSLSPTPDPDTLLEQFRRSDVATARELSDADRQAVLELQELRRELLENVIEAANERSDEGNRLLSLQTELLANSEELQTTLDQNLLWLPSAEPILSTRYPASVVRGAIKLVQPARTGAVLVELQRQTLRFWPVALLWVLVAFAIWNFRARFRDDIAETAKSVRKVREDSYFATPRVVVASVLLALPLPLVVALAGWLLNRSALANGFVLGVADALYALSLFLLMFLSLRNWAAKDGLFHRHIRIPEDLRRGIQIESHWFIPVAGTALLLLASTRAARDVDLYEGVSLTAFLVLAVSFGLLLYRLLWGRREAFTKTLNADSAFYRYRRILIGLAIGLPFLTALMAASGYFSTADEFLLRIGLTAAGLLGLYIVYGMLRRTVNIAHRRLSLKQALDKREAAIEARRREREAEQSADGEIASESEAPPPVDYAQIDLEETSRQTTQLLKTAIVIGFFALLWLIWRDLLPALSALDSVELYRNGERMVGEGADALLVDDYITLWDIVQGLVTVVLTVLAAKNLPGFLEIFVLNRSGLDRGVRYAIVTILGYIIVAIGIFIALGQLGVQWGQLGFIVAALGVGIGFGLQEIIANFISGLIILFERPIRVGDYVTVGEQGGTVSNIKIRATTLTDLDNKEILIPNKEFITGRVTNWTLTNSVIRLIIPVGIAYGSDTRRAQKLMLEVLQKETKVLDTPAPQVIFVNFGDSSLDFELRVFIRTFEDRFPVINSVHTAINQALEDAGISIPFPQRDLHLVSAGARLAVDMPPQAPAKPQADAKPQAPAEDQAPGKDQAEARLARPVYPVRE